MKSQYGKIYSLAEWKHFLFARPILFPAIGVAGGVILSWICLDNLRPLIMFSVAALLVGVLLLQNSGSTAPLTGAAFFLVIALVSVKTIGEQRARAKITDCQEIQGVIVEDRGIRGRLRCLVVKDQYGAFILIKLPQNRVDDSVQPGDELRCRTILTLPEPERNPGGFAEDRWLAGQGIYLSGTTSQADFVVYESRNQLIRSVHKVREYLKHGLFSWLGEADGALATAMFYGDDSSVSKEIKEAYRAAGFSHLMAVSGSNVGVVMAVAVPLLMKGNRERKRRIVLSGCAMLVFGFVTNWDATVTRAIIMQGVSLLAAWKKRKGDALNHLLSAVFLMIVFRPPFALNLGFWMSTGVTITIIGLQPLILGRLQRGKQSESSLLLSLQQAVAITLAATIGSLPFTLWFGQAVSPLFPLLNLCAGPLAAFITITTLFLGLISFIPIFPQILALALQGAFFLLNQLAYLGHSTAHYGLLSGRYATCVFLLGGALVHIIYRFRGQLRQYLAVGQAVILLLFYLASGPLRHFIRSDEIWFFDVGQGSAIYVQIEGKDLLIDTGTAEAGVNVLIPALQALGVKKLDLVIVTHLDEDHVGGLKPLLEAGFVAAVAGCPSNIVAAKEPELFAMCQEKQLPWDTLVAGDTIRLTQQDYMQILHPLYHTAAGNEDSVCILLAWHGQKILITGDAGFAEERSILRRNAGLQADILVAGHHGSKHSGSSCFLEAVKPAYAVIQSGQNNIYRHPAPELLMRLSKTRTIVKRTDLTGAFVLRKRKQEWNLLPYRNR